MALTIAEKTFTVDSVERKVLFSLMWNRTSGWAKFCTNCTKLSGSVSQNPPSKAVMIGV